MQPGQAVAVQMRDSPALITTMFGIWRAGAVFVPVNPRVPAAEVDTVLAATAPAAFITGTDAEVLTELDGARSYGPEAAFVMWTSGTTAQPGAIEA